MESEFTIMYASQSKSSKLEQAATLKYKIGN